MPLTLVTGANGFLGSAVTRELMENGFEIRTTGRSKQPVVDGPEYFSFELDGTRGLDRLLSGVQTVMHVAGLAHQFHQKRNSISHFLNINAHAVERLAKASALAGVEHFVLISSVSVYGAGHSSPPDEASFCCPGDIYAMSKYEGEQRLLEVARTRGLRATILRFCTIYGPGDPGNVGRLIRALDQRRFVWIGQGRNYKSLIHRSDAARACALAASQRTEAEHAVYNVSGTPVMIRDIVQSLCRALERRPPLLHLPSWAVMPTLRVASRWPVTRRWAAPFCEITEKWLRDDIFETSNFKRTFRFATEVSLDAGLSSQVQAYERGRRN